MSCHKESMSKQGTPALVIIIFAWHVSSKLAHAQSLENAIASEHDLALVILGTLV
jgi:hypothetical protein